MMPHLRMAWRHRLAIAYHTPDRIGASLFRLGAGLTILAQYLSTYAQRHFLFGPNGIVPYDWFVEELRQSRSFSLYALASSPLVFEGIFHLGIVVTLLWVLGWHTRLMTFLTWVFLWSLHARNPTLWDGGDNLIRIVLIYALFADIGAHWSLDAAHRRVLSEDSTAQQYVGALLHTGAVWAVALQLCLVYATAGLAKVAGEVWQNGTALYYILRTGEFAWTGYGAAIWTNSVLVTLLTYGTVAFQISFPFLLIAHPATRRLALVLGMGFHLGIGLVLGLHTFAAFMISIELLLVPDRDYLAAAEACRTLRRAVVTCWERLYRGLLPRRRGE